MEASRLLSVVHIFMIKDGELLLLRRKNTGRHDGEYGLPAGRLEWGEQLVAAANREAYEECGAVIEPADLTMLGTMHICDLGSERMDFFFSAEQWTGELRNREPDKCDDLRWFPADALPENVIPYVREAWAAFREGVWFSSYGCD